MFMIHGEKEKTGKKTQREKRIYSFALTFSIFPIILYSAMGRAIGRTYKKNSMQRFFYPKDIKGNFP